LEFTTSLYLIFSIEGVQRRSSRQIGLFVFWVKLAGYLHVKKL